MAVARLLVSNKSIQQSSADLAGVSQSRVAQANTVIRHAPELADAVMDGTVPLNDAYAEARQRKEAVEPADTTSVPWWKFWERWG